jgi:hypothetical protein
MRRRITALMLAGALLAPVGGCAATSTPDAEVTLHGTLVLQGNAPFVIAVLRQDNAKRWQLEGMTSGTAEALQNHRIEVRATVLPAATTGAQLPVLRVLRIEVQP